MLPVVSPRSQRKEPGVRVLTPRESSADKWHYILIVVPGHRSFIKNMTIGALQANTARNMVPTDGKFTADIAGENHKASEIQEQRLVNVSRLITLGVKQIHIGASKMECDTADYKQEKYSQAHTDEVSCGSSQTAHGAGPRQCHPLATLRRTMLVHLQRRSIEDQKP